MIVFSVFFRTMGLLVLVGLALLALPQSGQAAGQIFWDWPSGRQFSEIELNGLALEPGGALIPGLQAIQAGPESPEVCWRLASDNQGGFFTGTGHGGEIFHTDGQGKTSLFCDLSDAEVFSLLALPDGGLLAGCGPDGHLYRIGSNGLSQLLGKVDGGYIWAMASDDGGQTLYLATGSPAAVYRYTKSEGLQHLVTFTAQNTLDLMLDKDGSLLAATQGPGLVYRIDLADVQNPWLICETEQDEVRQFVRGEAGQLFFLALESSDGAEGGSNPAAPLGSMPPSLMNLFGEQIEPQSDKAALYRLEQDNTFTTWWTGNLDLMIVAWSSQWGWLGGGPRNLETGQASVHRLVPPATNHVIASWQGGDVLDLVVRDSADSNKGVLVGQAHPGGVMILKNQGHGSLRAMSPPLDAGAAVQWGRLSWTADEGPGKLRWSVRGGNRSQPDGSWTDWSDTWSGNDQALALPQTRFMQWRVEMPGPKGNNKWRLTSVSVSAWQDNVAPVIKRFTLENLTDISRGGLITSSENVTQKFASGLRVEFARKSVMGEDPDQVRAANTKPVRVMTWQGKDANNDKIIYKLEYRPLGEETWRPIMDETVEQMGSWDTSQVNDGLYQLRLTASDRLSNPAGLALNSHHEAGVVQVDNTAPVIKGFKVKTIETGLRVVFSATDESSKLGMAFVVMPDGTRQRLDPMDRICDSQREAFDARVTWPLPGQSAGEQPYRLRVEVWDLSGNMVSAEGEEH